MPMLKPPVKEAKPKIRENGEVLDTYKAPPLTEDERIRNDFAQMEGCGIEMQSGAQLQYLQFAGTTKWFCKDDMLKIMKYALSLQHKHEQH